jgi:DNA-binding beta-propeller fold protein YncE
VNAGQNTGYVAISPDGKHLYASNFIEQTISQYNVAADGSLTPMSTPKVHVDTPPYGLTVSPDGKNLYTVGFNSPDTGDAVAQFTVGTDGTLSPMSPALVDAAGDYLENITYSPFGRHLYAGGAEFTAGPDGALTRTAKTGTLWGFAIPQARRGTASFTASNPPAGVPAFLDAEASTATFGTITSYNWNFGDGTTQKRALPDVGHVYKKPGKYTVTLEVTTTGDCPHLQYSGTQTTCVPGTQWKTTRTVTVTKPAAVSSSPRRRATLSIVKAKRFGMVAFALAVPRAGTVTVTSTATSQQRGRAAGHRRRVQHVVIARRHRVARGAATMTFRIKPNARGRRLISRHKSATTVRLRVRYQPRHGEGRTIIRTVRVRR